MCYSMYLLHVASLFSICQSALSINCKIFLMESNAFVSARGSFLQSMSGNDHFGYSSVKHSRYLVLSTYHSFGEPLAFFISVLHLLVEATLHMHDLDPAGRVFAIHGIGSLIRSTASATLDSIGVQTSIN